MPLDGWGNILFEQMLQAADGLFAAVMYGHQNGDVGHEGLGLRDYEL